MDAWVARNTNGGDGPFPGKGGASLKNRKKKGNILKIGSSGGDADDTNGKRPLARSENRRKPLAAGGFLTQGETKVNILGKGGKKMAVAALCEKRWGH